MKVLVTGGTGFIGSHLSQRCVAEGWDTTVVDRELHDIEEWSKPLYTSKLFYFMHSDMADNYVLSMIRNKNFDIIFHQAAVPRVSYSVEHPAETTDENILKTVKVMEAAKDNCKRFIFASSSSVYGGAVEFPTPESCPLNPKSPYALQKKVCEEFCRLFGVLYNMDTVCLRYFNVFGRGQKGDSPYSTVLSAWCNAIKNNLPLRKDGTGEQSRDMCYIDNVIEANILAAKSEYIFKGQSYNIACNDRVSNNEILNALVQRYPNIEIQQAPFREGDVMHSRADISLANIAIGYTPKVYFWEGFNKTLEWWGI